MMSNKLNIGFVILTWNSERVISPCLHSIFEMEEFCSHVVIIDNGSSDGTLTKTNDFIPPEGSTLNVITYSSNMGTTVSRNAGIERLKDKELDYYCILDSDTVINTEAFKKMAGEMSKHPEYGIIGPRMITSDGVVQTSARAFPTLKEKLYKGIPIAALQRKGEKMEKQAVRNADSYPVDYLMSACWMIRPEALKKVGLLDEKIFYAPEDAEYCIQMWKSGYQVAFCPKAQIIHEWQRLSKKKLISKINWEHIKGLAYMFAKHKYAFSTEKLKKSFPQMESVKQ